MQASRQPAWGLLEGGRERSRAVHWQVRVVLVPEIASESATRDDRPGTSLWLSGSGWLFGSTPTISVHGHWHPTPPRGHWHPPSPTGCTSLRLTRYACSVRRYKPRSVCYRHRKGQQTHMDSHALVAVSARKTCFNAAQFASRCRLRGQLRGPQGTVRLHWWQRSRTTLLP